MQFFLPHLLKRSPRSRSEALSALLAASAPPESWFAFSRGDERILSGPSPPPPRAPSLPSPTRRLASQALARPAATLTNMRHAPRAGRHRRHDHAWDARVDTPDLSGAPCDRPHHEATRRRHSLHPARADLAHAHAPRSLRHSDRRSCSWRRARRGSTRLDEARRGAGEARHAQEHTTRRAGHIHGDHLDVFTVAGDRTCPQPRVPLPISMVRRSLSRSHLLQVGARPTSRL